MALTHARSRMVVPAAVVALALPLAACGGPDNGSDDRAVDRSSSPASPTPSPTPTVSAAEYDGALAAALKPLDTSLRAVNAAHGDAAVDKAFGTAADAAAAASDRIGATRSPDNAARAGDDLSGALSELSRGLADAKAGGARCAPSPRVALGTDGSVGQVRSAVSALTSLGYKVPLTLPRTERAQHRRLANGHLIKDSRRTGLGRLTVDNNADSDAVVTLVKGGTTAFSVYVRKGDDTTVRGVRNGSYTVYFTSGTDWNAAASSFTSGCAFERFDDKADFRTESVPGGTQYTILTFSLAKTIGGNATTSGVPEDQFPS